MLLEFRQPRNSGLSEAGLIGALVVMYSLLLVLMVGLAQPGGTDSRTASRRGCVRGCSPRMQRMDAPDSARPGSARPGGEGGAQKYSAGSHTRDGKPDTAEVPATARAPCGCSATGEMVGRHRRDVPGRGNRGYEAVVYCIFEELKNEKSTIHRQFFDILRFPLVAAPLLVDLIPPRFADLESIFEESLEIVRTRDSADDLSEGDYACLARCGRLLFMIHKMLHLDESDLESALEREYHRNQNIIEYPLLRKGRIHWKRTSVSGHKTLPDDIFHWLGPLNIEYFSFLFNMDILVISEAQPRPATGEQPAAQDGRRPYKYKAHEYRLYKTYYGVPVLKMVLFHTDARVLVPLVGLSPPELEQLYTRVPNGTRRGQ